MKNSSARSRHRPPNNQPKPQPCCSCTAFSERAPRSMRIMSRIGANAFKHFRRAALRSAPSSSRCQRDMSLRIRSHCISARRTLRCRRNGLSRCFAVMSQFESLLPTLCGSSIYRCYAPGRGVSRHNQNWVHDDRCHDRARSIICSADIEACSQCRPGTRHKKQVEPASLRWCMAHGPRLSKIVPRRFTSVVP